VIAVVVLEVLAKYSGGNDTLFMVDMVDKLTLSMSVSRHTYGNWPMPTGINTDGERLRR